MKRTKRTALVLAFAALLSLNQTAAIAASTLDSSPVNAPDVGVINAPLDNQTTNVDTAPAEVPADAREAGATTPVSLPAFTSISSGYTPIDEGVISTANDVIQPEPSREPDYTTTTEWVTDARPANSEIIVAPDYTTTTEWVTDARPANSEIIVAPDYPTTEWVTDARPANPEPTVAPDYTTTTEWVTDAHSTYPGTTVAPDYTTEYVQSAATDINQEPTHNLNNLTYVSTVRQDDFIIEIYLDDRTGEYSAVVIAYEGKAKIPNFPTLVWFDETDYNKLAFNVLVAEGIIPEGVVLDTVKEAQFGYTVEVYYSAKLHQLETVIIDLGDLTGKRVIELPTVTYYESDYDFALLPNVRLSDKIDVSDLLVLQNGLVTVGNVVYQYQAPESYELFYADRDSADADRYAVDWNTGEFVLAPAGDYVLLVQDEGLYALANVGHDRVLVIPESVRGLPVLGVNDYSSLLTDYGFLRNFRLYDVTNPENPVLIDDTPTINPELRITEDNPFYNGKDLSKYFTKLEVGYLVITDASEGIKIVVGKDGDSISFFYGDEQIGSVLHETDEEYYDFVSRFVFEYDDEGNILYYGLLVTTDEPVIGGIDFTPYFNDSVPNYHVITGNGVDINYTDSAPLRFIFDTETAVAQFNAIQIILPETIEKPTLEQFQELYSDVEKGVDLGSIIFGGIKTYYNTDEDKPTPLTYYGETGGGLKTYVSVKRALTGYTNYDAPSTLFDFSGDGKTDILDVLLLTRALLDGTADTLAPKEPVITPSVDLEALVSKTLDLFGR